MRPVSVEAFGVRIPLAQPMRLASELIATADNVLVRVVDAEGREGWGEAASAPTMTGERVPRMLAMVRREIAPAMLDGVRFAGLGTSGARAACEMALLDLQARQAGLPLAALLGTPLRDRAPAILMLGGQPAGVSASKGGQVLAASGGGHSTPVGGATHVKVKVGLAADPEEDVAALVAWRGLLGPSVHLSADANMGWSVAAALRFAATLPEGVLDYLEQPVAADDLAGMVAVAAALSCPVCFDEGLHGPLDIQAHAVARAAGGVGLKAIKLGGLRATLEADALARRLGLRTTWACKIAESSVGAAALLHAAAVLPEVDWGVSVTHRYLAEDLVAVPVAMVGGDALLPAGPGIGVAPEMARVLRYGWAG